MYSFKCLNSSIDTVKNAMSELYICEKPSLAKALFEGLGGDPKRDRKNGYMQLGNKIVTNCIGHMLELCDPEDFDDKYSKWSMNDLPMRYPYKLKVKKDTADQYKIIKSLMKDADIIYHVGDPDEEGQLLVDEILYFENWKGKTKRIFIADMTLGSIKKAIQEASDNNKHVVKGQIALARSISDQLWGYNLTRAYTLAAQLKGWSGVLGLGRVKTGIINLIDERCYAVENYKESFHYNVLAHLNINNIQFGAKYSPSENDPVNENGHIIDESFTSKIIAAIENQQATIVSAKHRTAKRSPPPPYSQSVLQSDCARKFGVNAADVLEAAQSLYEVHKVLTYPRSDCRFLSLETFSKRGAILNAIGNGAPMLKAAASGASITTPSKCFNDSKITAHTAIIPTDKAPDFSKLNDLEQKVYLLVARSFIANLYPQSEYAVSDIELKIAGLQFFSGSESRVFLGWESLYTNDKDNPDLESDDSDSTPLSSLKNGDKGSVIEGFTKAIKAPQPKYYVQSTLLRDLTHIAPFIEDDQLRKSMVEKFKSDNETAALATEATRAGILQDIFDGDQVELVEVKGYKEKAIKTTDIGRQLMKLLPNEVKKPDLTALWVNMGQDILKGKITVDDYVNNVYSTIDRVVNNVKSNGLNIKVDLQSCPVCSEGYLAHRKKGDNSFFSCTKYPDCTALYPEYNGKPFLQVHNCPSCNKPLVLRKGKEGYWFGCSGYSEGCKETFGCIGGKPAKKSHAKTKTFGKKKAGSSKSGSSGGSYKSLRRN